MNIDVRVVRLTFPPKYYKPGIHASLERAILKQLVAYGSVEAALEDGWLQEVRSAGAKNPGRRFMVYLTDKKHYHDIPISFCLAVNGQVVE
ncbi:MAG: hypothetical protein ACAI44_34400 [Candidatus Sericytochromatia bacterium]